MGIGGHMLGARKLRGLNRLTGMDFDRAYIRNGYCEGRVIEDGVCRHYEVDLSTGGSTLEPDPVHWVSCPPRT